MKPEFTNGLPNDAAFIAGWLRGMAETLADELSKDDVQALQLGSELLAIMAGCTQHGNARRRNLAGASLRTRQEEPTMSQQWPDPNEPQPIQQPSPTEAPGAPHTPESPRETPQPGDGDSDHETA